MTITSTLHRLCLLAFVFVATSSADAATPPRLGRYSGTVKVTKTIPSLNLSTIYSTKVSARIATIQQNPRLSILAPFNSNLFVPIGSNVDFLQGIILTIDGTNGQYGFFYVDPDQDTDVAPAVTTATTIKFSITVSTSSPVNDYEGTEIPATVVFAFTLTRAGN